ncbi:MAG: helix-turn-helix domain-containing protein [Terriglobia bacterium]
MAARCNAFMERLAEFDLLTLAEVAKLLHCSKAHICNAVAGRVPGCAPIPAVSLGRRKLVRRASLLSWIESNEQAAAPGVRFPYRRNEAAKTHKEK